MYLLKQWPLKSSTPPCLSSSPQLLFSHFPNPLVSPRLLIRPTLAQAVESPIYIVGASKESVSVAVLPLWKVLVFRGEACLCSSKHSICHWGLVCHHVPLFTASTFPSSLFLNHATPTIPHLSLFVPPSAKTLSSVCDPSVAPLCLAARGARARAAHHCGLSACYFPPHSCLAMDEKQREICLWFKVHPGNYSDWLKTWPTQPAMYNTTTPTQCFITAPSE